MIHGAVEALADFPEYGKILVPDSIQSDADELLYESNSLNNFLSERVVAAPGRDVTTQELQNAYISFRNTGNLPAVGLREVANRLSVLMKDKFGGIYSRTLGRGFGTARGCRNVGLINA